MALLIYIKTTLKSLVASAFMVLAAYLLVPIILAFVLGFISGDSSDNQLKYDVATVRIIDMDESDSSKALIDFLKSDNLKEIIKVSKSEKLEKVITIPKGYEESLIKGEKNNILIKDNEGTITINILKDILDLYHKEYLTSIQGGNKNLVNIESSVVNEVIDGKKDSNSYETMATNMISFVVSMIIYTTIISMYTDICKNMENRIFSMPITKSKLFIYDSISGVIYLSIILFGYVLFFKGIGLGFEGEITPLLLILVVTALFINSICNFVGNVFNEKYGKVVGLLLFILPFVAGEMFGEEAGALAKYTPTHYICKVLKNYTIYGGLNNSGKIIIGLVAISIILFIFSLTIINLRKEVKR